MKSSRAAFRLLFAAALLLAPAPVMAQAAPDAPKKAAPQKRVKPVKAKKSWPTRRPATPPAPLQMPPMGDIPFPQGERLVFKIQMLGADAGEVMLGVGPRTTAGGRPAVPLVGWVRSSAWLSKFYPIQDKLVVLADEKTFRPVKSDFYINEKGKKVEYHTKFNQGGKRIESVRVRPKEKNLERTYSPDGPIYDSLSAVYAARRMDLKPGLAFSAYVWDGRRERLLTIKVTGQEKVWTEIGWFDTMKLDLTSQITGGFVTKKELDAPSQKGSAWIGLDPQRTPVKVITPTRLGDAQGLLFKRFVEQSDVQGEDTTPPAVPSGPAPASAPAPPSAVVPASTPSPAPAPASAPAAP